MEAPVAPPPVVGEVPPPAEPAPKTEAEIAREKIDARNKVLNRYDSVYFRLKRDTAPLVEKLQAGDPLTDAEKQQVVDYHIVAEGIKSANKKNYTGLLSPESTTPMYSSSLGNSNADVIQEFGHEGREYAEPEGLPVEPLLRQLQREREERWQKYRIDPKSDPERAKSYTKFEDEDEEVLRGHNIPFKDAHVGNEQYMRDRQQYEALLAHIDDISGHKLRNTGSPEGEWVSAEKTLEQRLELTLPPQPTDEELAALQAKERADWDTKVAAHMSEEKAKAAASPIEATVPVAAEVAAAPVTEAIVSASRIVTPEKEALIGPVLREMPEAMTPEEASERESRVQKLLSSTWAKRLINPITIGLVGMTVGTAGINRDTIDFVPPEKPAVVAVGGHPDTPAMPDVRFPVPPEAAFARTITQTPEAPPVVQNSSVIEKQGTAEAIVTRDVDPYLPKQGGSVEGYAISKLVQQLFPAEAAALPKNPDGSIKSDDPEFQRLAATIPADTIQKFADTFVADITAENPGEPLVGPDPANPQGRVFHIGEAQTIALKPTGEYIKDAGIQMPVSPLPTAEAAI